MTFEEFTKKVASFEGFVDHTYTDATGTKTIGYGFTDKNLVAQLTITRKQADEILQKKLKDLFAQVKNKCVHWGYVFNDDKIFALTDFVYNCGIGNLTQLTKDGKRTPTEIATKILEYNKSKGRVLTGLTRRRQWEQSIFCGNYTASDVQNLCNSIIYELDLNLELLTIDGIIGQKSINTIGQILALIR